MEDALCSCTKEPEIEQQAPTPDPSFLWIQKLKVSMTAQVTGFLSPGRDLDITPSSVFDPD